VNPAGKSPVRNYSRCGGMVADTVTVVSEQQVASMLILLYKKQTLMFVLKLTDPVEASDQRRNL
jgi:hypothetical protein